MRAIVTTTTSGALISVIGGSATLIRCLGGLLHHTGAANAVMLENASGGNNFLTLKVTTEMQCQAVMFPPGGILLKDIYYTLSAGTLILYVE